uniref:Uncharacterized protein n=1 Tax=Knipowitschia caucasica TaxID=637954 RepID=A0AAV2JAP9_KNICA
MGRGVGEGGVGGNGGDGVEGRGVEGGGGEGWVGVGGGDERAGTGGQCCKGCGSSGFRRLGRAQVFRRLGPASVQKDCSVLPGVQKLVLRVQKSSLSSPEGSGGVK